ncbi:glycine zipper 2TM domain-containing protein [Bordetella avium]|uniref:Lipoprotein n=1 Tax=Bordetella avium (strain 197N) TaxID=360910 RepID=Q2KXF9_BORA1|nr:glycine zipper 2TM domain-containing protein [Bordetella avium]AZY48218.1 glycine zipper 2TM domain-containing protein [Bordetella avium]RIQ13537.1 glycine zipper 2TM domain-containing protein [Bordetella avium]RIQ16508.1 glycine zipper 2TM domain-containing protein [Bordetella avium]RIQ31266.1 glycine zipper 2TM domain-containing protein [Bordetella avium]RIQ36884.1 glycine zipper 2TM domain-containing protein [Bordetella avium]
MNRALIAITLTAGALALAGCQNMPGGAKASSEFDCIAGTVGGAVVGGLLGSMVGGGTGKTIATVAGAGAGSYAGNQIGCR